MTKGKKWTLRLLGVAALALLICLCFLGSTMARYTSSGTGSGSLTVAIWDLEAAEIEIDPSQVDSVSPSKDDYSTSDARKNQSTWVQALKMENNSAVDATVDIALATDEDGNANIGLTWADNFTWGIGWTGTDDIEYDNDDIKYDADGNTIAKSGRAQTNAYAKDLMAKFGFTGDDAACKASFISLVNAWGIFSLELASVSDGSDGTTGTLSIKLGAGTGTYAAADGSDSKDIYASVDWTSICQANASSSATIPSGFTANSSSPTNDEWEEFSDAVDTILGMYVTTLSFSVTWTAVQASTIPQG